MIKKLAWAALTAFVLLNVIAYNHAYKFTHFSGEGLRTADPKELTSFDKAALLFTGISNPKPSNKQEPDEPYKVVTINSDVALEGWLIDVPDSKAKGTVILFHGYTGNKSQLLERAAIFRRLGYRTLLVDFRGSGGSEGHETHLAYTESAEVRDCYNYVLGSGETNIHLFGTSMGAAAIIKAVNDYAITPASIILECPFGKLYNTVAARFRMLGLPPFPMAAILTFWGGVQLGFRPFSHNPSEYAKAVTVPALLMFGERDDRVSMKETTEIYDNLAGPKHLVTYKESGHDLFTGNEKWQGDVAEFILSLETTTLLHTNQ